MTIKYADRFDDAGSIAMEQFIEDMLMCLDLGSNTLLIEFSDEDLALEYLAIHRARLDEFFMSLMNSSRASGELNWKNTLQSTSELIKD